MVADQGRQHKVDHPILEKDSNNIVGSRVLFETSGLARKFLTTRRVVSPGLRGNEAASKEHTRTCLQRRSWREEGEKQQIIRMDRRHGGGATVAVAGVLPHAKL